MAKDFIKAFWEKQAITYKDSHLVSWGDNYMIDLEIETIGQYITSGTNVLDVGCGNGYSTLRQYENCKVKKIVGVDYCKNMIAIANRSKQKLKIGNNAKFVLGDIRKLFFDNDTFDVVYTTRALINLSNWEQQLQGIEECIRVTRKGGKIIFSEAFWEPLVLLNSMRTICNLSPLVEHDFNRYLKEQKLIEFLHAKKYKYEINDFSSVYYFGSRILRELITKADDYPGYSNPINDFFYKLEKEYSGGKFGIQKAIIIYK